MNESRNLIIVSIHGTKNGGVEHVANYQHQFLKDEFDVKILKARHLFGKMDLVIYPFLFSFILLFYRKDMVISQSWNAFLYKSDFIIAHGTLKGYMSQFPNGITLGGKWVSFMERISAKRAKKVIAVCERVADEYVYYYKIPREKILVLNNCVNTDVFFPKKNRKTAKDELRVLFVGNICSGKGLDRLLEFSKYIEGIDGVKLYMASNSEDGVQGFKDFSKTIIKKSLGMKEMDELYNSCDVLYFPTRYEGFSMASLEALSTGMPVIGSKFAVPREFDKYRFTYRTSDFQPALILKKAYELKEKYSERRSEIHEMISEDFGQNKYARELKKIIKND